MIQQTLSNMKIPLQVSCMLNFDEQPNESKVAPNEDEDTGPLDELETNPDIVDNTAMLSLSVSGNETFFDLAENGTQVLLSRNQTSTLDSHPNVEWESALEMTTLDGNITSTGRYKCRYF